MANKFKYYEIYCERINSEWISESDNFSLCLKVPAGIKKPSIKEVTKLLGDRLTIDGDHYEVCGLWAEDEGGWEHTDFNKEDIFLFKAE